MSGSTPRLGRWFSDAANWPDAVLPDYDGGSIANLAGSLLDAFDAPSTGLPALRADILPPLFLHDARVVVLLVVDGFGLHSLEWARTQGALEALIDPRVESRMTSIFPSTTAAALTTLQTGFAPSQHGIAGYTLYLQKQSATINMVTWKPVGGMPVRKPLPQPKGYLGVPNLYERLDRAGIESTVVSNLAFMDSALTNLQSPGVPYSGHRTPAEFAGLLLRETRKPDRRFVFGYWDGFDALSHTHGPESEIALNELHVLDRALGRGFFGPVADAGGDVAVVLVADHGHAPISEERTRSLKDILRRHSQSRPIPAGDRRGVTLAFDSEQGLRDLRDLAGEDGIVISVRDAIEAGLYGPGPFHPELLDRIGKTLLLAKTEAAFLFPQSNNHTPGGHGSLTPQEMLVPLLGWRY